MWKALLGVLQSLPIIVDLVKRFVDSLESIKKRANQKRFDKYVEKGHILKRKIEKAKTDTERRELLKKLSDHSHNRPS